jgi:lysophospholipase L1-like esterase
MLVDGDSLNVNGDWPGQFATLRPEMTHAFIGRAGSLANESIREFGAQAAPYAAPRYTPRTYAIWVAANDVANNQGSADEIFLRLRRLWKMGRVCGFRVVAFTVTLGQGIVTNGRQAIRTALNEEIRAASVHYDALADVDGMFLDLSGADYYLDTDYFFDGIHMTTLGAQHVAALVSGLLEEL